MTWTYSLTNLASSSSGSIRNRVRTLIGDTSSGLQLIQDEQIDMVAATYGGSNEYMMGALCCELIASSLSYQVHTKNGELWVYGEQRAIAFREQAKTLRKRANAGAGIYVGGRSAAEKDTQATDTTIVQPLFEKGMDDYYGPGGSTSTAR